MEYLIGLDIGTSSVKGVLLTADGYVAHSAKGTFAYDRTGSRVELQPEGYLSVCLDTIRELANAAKGAPIKGVCASSASGNLLLLDREGRPLTNIIGWQDARVTNEARELLPDLDRETFYRQIGWPFGFTSMALAQLCYIKKHDPELLARCGTAAMSTEYLYFALTGKWGISPSAGITYYLIDRQTGKYIRPILDRLGLDEAQLPPVLPCGTVLGGVLPDAAARCALPAGTPVMLGSFDHPSAARGAGVLHEGEMLLSCGTSWVAFFPVKDAEKGFAAGALVDPFLSPKGCHGVMSSVTSLSERLQYYTARYIDDSPQMFATLSALAQKSVSGAHGLTIDLLNEPEEKLGACPKEDVARAIMEGAVSLLKNKLVTLAQYGITAKRAVMVGGPSADPYWTRLIGQMCDLDVSVIHGAFAGAVGAAVIAGVGSGIYENEDAARTVIRAAEAKRENESTGQ